MSNVRVRIKLVDLNHTGYPQSPSPRSSTEHVSALVGSSTERPNRPFFSSRKSSHKVDYAQGEICTATGNHIHPADFENHIETCITCSNRVELQLDFMETLEVAIYQRRADPASERVRGAMLISTPELNFAVCGEIEL
jgi:hypothetical protein